MAIKKSRLAEIYKSEKTKGGGLASTLGKRFAEKIDPRQIFNQSGFLAAALPSMFKAYSATSAGAASKISTRPTKETMVSEVINSKLDELNSKTKDMVVNTQLSAKNSLVLPMMARDMNLMRQNIAKMAKAQGVKPTYKADMFFKGAAEREKEYESKFGKTRALTSTPTLAVGEKKESAGGIIGMLGTLFAPLLGIGTTIVGAITSALSGIGEFLLKGITSVFSVDNLIKALGLTGSVLKQIISLASKVVTNPLFLGIAAITGIYELMKFFREGIDEKQQRYMELAKKKQETGLTPEEEKELKSLDTQKFRQKAQEELKYDPIRNEVVTEKERVQKVAAKDARSDSQIRLLATEQLMEEGVTDKTRDYTKRFEERVSELKAERDAARSKPVLEPPGPVSEPAAPASAAAPAAPAAPAAVPATAAVPAVPAAVPAVPAAVPTPAPPRTPAPEAPTQGAQTGQNYLANKTRTPPAAGASTAGVPPGTPAPGAPTQGAQTGQNYLANKTRTPPVSPTPVAGGGRGSINPQSVSPTRITEEPSEELVNFVKQKENPELSKTKGTSKAYWDYKQYSIGYGTKADNPDEVITEEEADKRLREALSKSQKAVIAHANKHGYDFNQNQINALSSFVYNLGSGVLNQLTANGTRSIEEIANKIPEYNKVREKGELVVNRGLTKRRQVEFAMFSAEPMAPSTTLAAAPAPTPAAPTMTVASAPVAPSMTVAAAKPPAGPMIAAATTEVAKERMQLASAPVIISAPTTNNVQSPARNQQAYTQPSVVDSEFMKLLVGRTVTV